jgi:hypothetical protein
VAHAQYWYFLYLRPVNQCSDGYAAIYNAADFNSDSRMDVVVGQSEGSPGIPPPPGGLFWYEAPSDRRNGTWIKHTIDATFIDAHNVKIADMDHKGTSDLVTAEQDQSPLRRVSVFYNDGLGNFTQEVISNAAGHQTQVGDIEGNGSTDILSSGHGFFGLIHPLQIFIDPVK